MDLDLEPLCRGLSDQILHARMAQRLGLGDLEPGEQMPSHVAIDEEQPSRGHRLELQLHLALPQTSVSNPTTIGVRVNDGPIENFHLSTDDEILTVLSSTDASKFRGISLVEFHLGAEISAGESRKTAR
jgi:hypothetical protein